MKKFFFLLLVFFLYARPSSAQVMIFDEGLRTKLMTLFPQCFDSNGMMDTTCAVITTCRHLDLSAINMQMGFGDLRYFDSLRYVDVSRNAINDLIIPLQLPLDTLICSQQYDLTVGGGFPYYFGLHSISNLAQSHLKYLACDSNGLGTLSNLPQELTYLNCSNQRHKSLNSSLPYPTLTSLPALPVGLQYLNCSFNGLTSLPVLPSGLKYLNASDNYTYFVSPMNNMTYYYPGIAQLPDLPDGLQILQVQNNPISCLPVLPLTLVQLRLESTNVGCLPNAVPGLTVSGGPFPVCSTTNPNDCGGTNPFIGVNPASISGLTLTVLGNPSDAQGYFITAHNLTPASGNITLTPSANVEIAQSQDVFGTFTSSPINIPYTGGSLNATRIFTRISANAPNGAFSGSIAHSGGSAPDKILPINGVVSTNAPVISITPTQLVGFTTTVGTASPSNLFTITASNLSPAASFLPITVSPATDFELSLDNINYSQTVSINYTNGQLINRTVLVRIKSTATVGSKTGNAIIQTSSLLTIGTVSLSGVVNPLPTPVWTANPSTITGLTTIVGGSETIGSYVLSGNNLSPANGNYSVAASSGLLVSTDQVNFSSTLSIPYSNSQVVPTTLYVKISNTVTQTGAFSGSITNDLNSLSAAVTVSGTVIPPPVINAGPGITGLETVVGTISASASYSIQAQNLLPASGNITVTPGNNLEVSTDNVNFSSTSIDLPYTGGQLTSTTLYTRIAASAPAGTFSGTMVHTGGSAPAATVQVGGYVYRPELTAGPDIAGLVTLQGTASASAPYQVSGVELFPVAGNLSVVVSTGIEISLDNVNFSASPLLIPYTNHQLPITTLYARIAASAPQGNVTGTNSHTGGNATEAILHVNGQVARPAISVSRTTLDNLTSVRGNASPSESYFVSGNDLFPRAGNLTIESPAHIEISVNNQQFSRQLNIGYVDGLLQAQTIYVRMATDMPIGNLSGTILNKGGNAENKEVTVTGVCQPVDVQLAPNPAHGRTMLYLPAASSHTRVDIYSSNNVWVNTVTSQNSIIDINLNGLPAGIYFLKITTDSETLWKKLLID
jgi:hypothetical protein